MTKTDGKGRSSTRSFFSLSRDDDASSFSAENKAVSNFQPPCKCTKYLIFERVNDDESNAKGMYSKQGERQSSAILDLRKENTGVCHPSEAVPAMAELCRAYPRKSGQGPRARKNGSCSGLDSYHS